VAFPTETVYGLGANAFDERAVGRIYEVKRRPSFDPLIVHVATHEQLERVALTIPPELKKLTDAFWPGPLTVVVPKNPQLPAITTAGLETVAVRMPDHPVALFLIQEANLPIAAPSANPFGYVSPTTARQVAETLGDAVDLILDAGSTPIGVESTIVTLRNDKILLLRPGGLSVEEIERVLGRKVEELKSEDPLAPGMLKRHYSPKSRVVILESWEKYYRLRALYRRVLLVLPKRMCGVEGDVIFLSERGDLREMASNLFRILYAADRKRYEVIAFFPVPERGLGKAIMNRLRKAAGI